MAAMILDGGQIYSNISSCSLQICHYAVNRDDRNYNYRKVPKFSDARNFAVIPLKFKQRGQT